jgi:hypothetical protein
MIGSVAYTPPSRYGFRLLGRISGRNQAWYNAYTFGSRPVEYAQFLGARLGMSRAVFVRLEDCEKW